MTAIPHPLPPAQINWTKVAFIFTASAALIGWVASDARSTERANERLVVLEARTQPLADGDLVRVQQDVAWIRNHLEREGRR